MAAGRARFTPAWSARRSFIFIAAGTAEEPDCRQATPRLRFRAGCSSLRSAAARRFIPLASLPANRIMSSFVSPLLEKERERERRYEGEEFPLPFFSSLPRSHALAPFSSTAPLTVRGPRKRRLNAARERRETRVG